MPDKVTLVRHDGTLIQATPEQASRLALLGYREQSTEENIQNLTQEAQADYYTSPGQKLTTAAEGFGAGISFGGTDYLFGDDQTKLRAAYNPGTRLSTETLGALVPLVLTEGGSAAATGAEAVNEAGALSRAARVAPTSLLSDAARALAPGAKGSLTHSVLTGVIEGGVYGGAGAADHAYLDGDPITAEAILHGVGWGSLIGGGISAIGHGVTALGNHEAAAIEAEANKVSAAQEAENVRVSAKNAAEQARYEEQLAKAKAGVKEPVPVGTLRGTAGADFGNLKAEVENLAGSMKQATTAADASVESTFKSIIADGETAPMSAFGDSEVEFVGQVKKIKSLYSKVTKAVEAGKYDTATEAAAEYTSHVTDIASKLKMDLPNPGKALDDLIAVRATHEALKGFPSSVEAFATLSPAKLESTIAALDKIKSLPFDNVQAVADAATNFSKSLGIEAQDLRSTWRAAKDVYKSEGKVPKEVRMPRPPRVYEPKTIKEPAESGDQHVSFGRKVLGYAVGGKAYVVARAAGAGKTTAFAAYKGVRDAVTYGGRDLVGVRAAVTGKIKQAAANYLPSTGKAVRTIAPRVEPLARSIYGYEDKSTTDKRQLALNRVREFNEFRPTASDSIYRAIEPLAATQPALGPALHKASLNAFNAMYEMMPKDPGVLSKLKSIWKPSDIHAAVLAKQLAVWNDPIGEATDMLVSGQFDPIKVQTLKEIAPNNWQELRIGLLERITQPGVMDKMSYHQQIGLSTMLDIPIHTSMAPEYIATSQQMFLDRNKPLSAAPRMGQGGGMPNPADNVNATSGQKTEAH